MALPPLAVCVAGPAWTIYASRQEDRALHNIERARHTRTAIRDIRDALSMAESETLAWEASESTTALAHATALRRAALQDSGRLISDGLPTAAAHSLQSSVGRVCDELAAEAAMAAPASNPNPRAPLLLQTQAHVHTVIATLDRQFDLQGQRITASLAAAERTRTELLRAGSATTGAISLVGVFLGVVGFTRGISGRVNALNRNAMRLVDGQPLEPIQSGGDELDDLAGQLGAAALVLRARERALQKSEELYRTIVTHAGEGICVVDQNLVITFANPKMAEMLHCQPDGLTGSRLTEYVVSPDMPEWVREFDAHPPAPGELSLTLRRADGVAVLTRAAISGLVDNDGGYRGAVAVVRDVTSEQRAMRADAHLAAIVRSSATGIYGVDRDGRCTFVNSAGADLLGYHPDELVGAEIHNLVHGRHADGSPYPVADCPISQALRNGIAVRASEEIFLRRDGRPIPVEFACQPVVEDGTISGGVVNFTDISERKAFEQELTHQSLHDALTSLPNRLLLLERLERALTARARHGGEVAVLGLDLDRFKVVNDSLGHLAGDELLVEVGRRLLRSLRDTDTVARFGGDEFVVLCEHLDGEHAASAVAERLLAAFHDPIRIRGRDISLTTSIGIAYAHDGAQPQELLRTADVAMYRAKEQGGGRAEVFDEAMSQRVVARLELEADLRRALQHGELRVFYQPVMDLQTDQPVGVEALVRWVHPQRGLVSPAEFIPIAEDTGLIVPLGSWVMKEACRQAAEWRRAHSASSKLTVAVNVSARQFTDSDLVVTVSHALETSGLPAQALCLEVTESTVMQDADASARILRQLKLLGVTISVDDFGTGYSSMAQLKTLPFDTLKIDRAFVSGLDHNAEDRAIATAILSLARALGLDVIAEGVERPEQAVRLRQLGCDAAQGFHWSRPLPPGETMQWITSYIASPTSHDTATPPIGRYRVVVVDDHPDHRTLIRRVLERNGSFDIVAEGAGGQAAITLSALHQPDLLLLDRRLRDNDGDQALPQIRRAAPATRVVLFSGTVPTVIPDGVTAVLENGSAPHQLINVLLEAASRPNPHTPAGQSPPPESP